MIGTDQIITSRVVCLDMMGVYVIPQFWFIWKVPYVDDIYAGVVFTAAMFSFTYVYACSPANLEPEIAPVFTWMKIYQLVCCDQCVKDAPVR